MPVGADAHIGPKRPNLRTPTNQRKKPKLRVILSRGDSRVPKDLVRDSFSERRRSFDSASLHSG